MGGEGLTTEQVAVGGVMRFVEQFDMVREHSTTIGRYLNFDHQFWEVTHIGRMANAKAGELAQAASMEGMEAMLGIERTCNYWLRKANRSLPAFKLDELRNTFRDDLLQITKELADMAGVRPALCSVAEFEKQKAEPAELIGTPVHLNS